jgi:DNA-binding CsgD family transcriptional regulator
MTALDEKIARLCVEYALSPQQSRVVEAMLHGALSNEALGRRLGMRQWTLRKHLDRIAQKTMTRSRTELLYLFYEGRRGE